jgi:DNA-binding IclR family transcriptional regulator
MSGAEGGPWALGEIAGGVGMHPSTAHRVLAHLVEDGLVRHDPVRGRYGLGLEFLRLAWKAVGHEALRDVALPHLRELSADTGETALFGLYEPARQQMLFVAAVESAHAIRHVRPLHEWLPIHGGATGRAILAFLPENERRGVLTGPLPAVTKSTITDRATLEQVLDEVRGRGYAVSSGERAVGGVGVAAPVLAGDGRVLGAVGVGIPEQRFRAADERQLARRVMAAAAAVARDAGART